MDSNQPDVPDVPELKTLYRVLDHVFNNAASSLFPAPTLAEVTGLNLEPSFNAQISNAQSSNAQSPNAQSSNAQSPNAQSPNAQSPNAQSPNAQSSNAQSSNAQSSNAQTAPAQTAPAQTAPAQTAPAQTAPAQTAPAPCRQDGPVRNRDVGEGVKRCDKYFKKLDDKMRKDWSEHLLKRRCKVFMYLVNPDQTPTQTPTKTPLDKAAQESMAAMAAVTENRAQLKPGAASLWSDTGPVRKDSLLLKRAGLADKVSVLSQSVTGALKRELREVELFLERYCSLQANRLLDWRIMLQDTGVLTDELHRKVSSVYGKFRALMNCAFGVVCDPNGLKEKRDAYLTESDELEDALNRISVRQTKTGSHEGGGFVLRVGSFCVGVMKTAALAVCAVVSVAVSPIVLAIGSAFGLVALNRDYWRRGNLTAISSSVNLIQAGLFVNIRIAFMMMNAAVYEIQYGEASLHDLVPAFKVLWALITKFGNDAVGASFNAGDILPMTLAFQQMESFNDSMTLLMPHLWAWGGSEMLEEYDKIFVELIPKYQNTRESDLVYQILKSCTFITKTKTPSQTPTPTEIDVRKLLISELDKQQNNLNLNPLGRKVLARLKMSADTARRPRIFRLVYATLKVMLVKSYKSDDFAQWLVRCFPPDKTSQILPPKSRLLTLPKSMMEILLQMMNFLEEKANGPMGNADDKALYKDLTDDDVIKSFLPATGGRGGKKKKTTTAAATKKNEKKKNDKKKQTGAKWHLSGKRVQLGDGTTRALYTNARGELRIRRMVTRNGRTVATHVVAK